MRAVAGHRWTAVIGLGAAAVVFWWSVSSVAGESPSPSPVTSASPATVSADGAGVFVAKCSNCHGVDGKGGEEGPSLHGLPAGQETIAGVVDIVEEGPDGMPSFADQLTESQIDAVAEYVVDQFATPGQLALGGEVFRLDCAGCHGVTGIGGALIYSDENAPHLFEASSAEVLAAVRGGPGTMPAFNQTNLTDESAASVAVYVEMLKHPANPGGIAIPPPGPVTEGFVAALVGLGLALMAAAWVTKGGRG
jgi:quinol---cytochrome-c reductase cytochrome c subunit